MRHAAVGKARCRCAIATATATTMAIAWLSGLGVVRAEAQVQGQTDVERQVASGPRFLMTPAHEPSARGGAWEDASHLAVFQRRIAVDLHGVSLGHALSDVGQKAGLGVTYSPTVIRSDVPVNLSAPDITVGAAFSALLYDAGVDVLLTASGRVSIIKRVALEAPVGSVAGRVTDAKTGRDISGVEVSLEDTHWRAVTGEGGRYRLADVKPGSYTLVTRRIGYSPQRRAVTVAADQEALVDLALQAAPTILNEVVVSGTVLPTEAKALPTPVTVITAEDLERQHVRRLDQALQLAVPGSVVREPQIAESPVYQIVGMRGASSLGGGYGNNPKVYVDGIELANDNAASIDPTSIERIEVIRGPQAAAIYGSDAMAGVIQIFTKRGAGSGDRAQFEVNAALGRIESNFAGTALRQDYSGSLSGRYRAGSYRVGGGYRSTGEWVPDYGDRSPTFQGGTQIEQGAFTIDLTTRLEQHHFTQGFDPRPAAQFGVQLPFLAARGHVVSDSRQESYAMRVDHRPTRWWQQSVTVGITRDGSSDWQQQATHAYPGDTLLGGSEFDFRRLSVAYHGAATATLSSWLKAALTVGGDHYSYTGGNYYISGALTRQPLVLAPGGGVSSYPNQWHNTGVFTEAQLNVRETFFVTGSLRAEDNGNFGDAYNWPVSPRIGASYVRPVGGATVKLRTSYGHAIRAPFQGAKDSVNYGGGYYLRANPGLRPERQTGPDAGVDLVFGSRGSFSVTYFRQIAKDFIYPITAYSNPVTGIYLLQYVNLARVKNVGWEFEGRLTLGWVDLRGQFAITRSRPEDLGPIQSSAYLGVGQPFVGIPDHTGGLTVTVLPLPRTTVTAVLAYMGSWRSFDGQAQLRCEAGVDTCDPPNQFIIDYPGYGKFGLSVEQQLRRGMTAYVNVEDLTNTAFKRMEENTQPVQGRIVTAGARVAF